MKSEGEAKPIEPGGFIDPENMGGEQRNGKKPKQRKRVRRKKNKFGTSTAQAVFLSPVL
jgi:hypothetical protein